MASVATPLTTSAYDILAGCAGAGAGGMNTGALRLNDGLKTGAETDGTNTGAAALSTDFVDCNVGNDVVLVTYPAESVLSSLAVSPSIPSSASLSLITNRSSSSATCCISACANSSSRSACSHDDRNTPSAAASRSAHQAATVAPFAQK